MSAGSTPRLASAGESLLPRHFFTGLEETNWTSSSGFLLIGKESLLSLWAKPESILGKDVLLRQSLGFREDVLKIREPNLCSSRCDDNLEGTVNSSRCKCFAAACQEMESRYEESLQGVANLPQAFARLLLQHTR